MHFRWSYTARTWGARAGRLGDRRLLEEQGSWGPLWRVPTLASGHDPAGTAPFCSATRMVRD